MEKIEHEKSSCNEVDIQISFSSPYLHGAPQEVKEQHREVAAQSGWREELLS